MHPEDFEASLAGRCIRTPRGYWAFVPHPLPPSLELNWSLVRLLSEADRALSELAGAGRLLPNPHLLIGPYMRREAVLSSRIENTQAGMGDLFFFEADETEPPKAPDVREVANYVQALDYGLTRLQELPISTRLVREIHERLMAGVRGEYGTPGEFRRRTIARAVRTHALSVRGHPPFPRRQWTGGPLTHPLLSVRARGALPAPALSLRIF